MKAMYVTSVEPFSGKTAFCLGLGKRFQAEGHKVGYLKPLSTQPWRTPEGQLADEDAAFVKDVLGLEEPLEVLSPIIITGDRLRLHLEGASSENLLEIVEKSAAEAGKDHDVLLLEGGASLRQGYAVGLSNLEVAKKLGAPAIVLVRFEGEMRTVDGALTAKQRLGDQLSAVVINQVPDENAREFIRNYAAPFLENQGVHVLGALPSVPRLSALTVGELIELLDAEVLTEKVNKEKLVETFTLGAMTAEAALNRFRKQTNKAVITGGDRTDIQLAALETSTSALILTGNLRPSPIIIQQANAQSLPVLLVPENTMPTVERIERAYGKTRLGQSEKLESFLELIEEHLDLSSVYKTLGLGS